MNHKRKRPKHQRAGCLMCKPHKDERGKNSAQAQTLQVKKLPSISELHEDADNEGECDYCGGETCVVGCDCGNESIEIDGVTLHLDCAEIVKSEREEI